MSLTKSTKINLDYVVSFEQSYLKWHCTCNEKIMSTEITTTATTTTHIINVHIIRIYN